MRYKPFKSGDNVITILSYLDIPTGIVGIVKKRWLGTGYVVRLENGTFVLLDSSEFGSTDPGRGFRLEEGDVGVVTSGHHHHDYARVGDWFKVYKVVHDIDYYEVQIDNDLRLLAGFMLAPNI